jgi:hypothetical protein
LQWHAKNVIPLPVQPQLSRLPNVVAAAAVVAAATCMHTGFVPPQRSMAKAGEASRIDTKIAAKEIRMAILPVFCLSGSVRWNSSAHKLLSRNARLPRELRMFRASS